ncbi:hypothetical protein ACEPAF_223 [Sanghuangporus sanghuang]
MAVSGSGSTHRGNANATSADIAGHPYAKKVQALIKLINDLRAHGAQADVDLPRIVVIGNQSAGKSSLVEAMTKITVPRSQDTCTRCPMECRMTYSPESFRCQISLRIEVDELGNPVQNVREVKFGPVLTDKSTLEKMLQRAQLAILNPTVPKEFFVDLYLDNVQPGQPPFGSRRQLQFSPNVVCIDIFSPVVTNLSFIDLPGIISNVADGEDRENIKLIEDLVKRQIAGNALILLTVTMRDDVHNQKAALLAKEADPNGIRTIGVLTKPDTLLPGEHDAWLDILAGRKHPLTHGYYVTKLASAAELKSKITYDENRDREMKFFANESPWCDQVSSIVQRMGVPNLTAHLSVLLSQLIEKTLPQLRQTLRSSLLDTQRELYDLPAPPSEDPTIELLQLIVEFDAQLGDRVRGLSGHESLLQKCRPAYAEFQADIKTTTPNFIPFLKSEMDEETEELVSETGYRQVIEEMGDSFDSIEEPIFLDDMRDRISRMVTRELPHNTPYRAKVQFIEERFSLWQQHSRACFEKVNIAYQQCLDELIAQTFGKYKSGGLFDEVRNIVDFELQRARIVTLDRIAWLLELEKDPFTLNDVYLSERNKFFTSFRQQRQKKQAGISIDSDDIRRILESLAGIGIRCREEDIPHIGVSEPYEQELLMMAEASAFFRIAYKRIIDNLPRLIDVDFLKGLRSGMNAALFSGLRLDKADKDTAKRYLSEDPDTTHRRHSLEVRRDRLQELVVRLNGSASLGA